MITPRHYQNRALSATLSEFAAGRVATLLDIATGCGKTYLFGPLADLVGGRALILVNREELLRQAVAKTRAISPHLGVSVERREHRGELRGERNLFDAEPSRIVVASKDTLCRKARLARFDAQDFDLVIVDEAIHAVPKNASYAAILRKFCAPPIGTGRAKLVGVCGALDRADGEALAGFFQSVAYRYSIAQAIDDGYLVRPLVKRVHIHGLTLVDLPTTMRDGVCEITQTALDRVMRRREYAYSVARPLLDESNQHGRKRQGVVFCSSGPQAEMMADVLNAESPHCASVCLGEPYQNADQRRAAIERFDDGDVQFLCSCDVLVEGWDSDRVEIVALKPCRSRQRVAQMVGRGTRPLNGCVDACASAADRLAAIAASPKPYVTVLDPCGVSEKHSLVNITDIFQGKYTRTAARVHTGPPSQRPDDLDERRAARDALREIENAKLDGLRVAVNYEVSETDMMAEKSVPAEPVPRSEINHPATEAQCRWLEAHSIRVPAGLTKRQASDIIQSIKARRAAAPATTRQREILAKFGYGPNVTFGVASEIIQRIADNGWKKPSDVSDAASA